MAVSQTALPRSPGNPAASLAPAQLKAKANSIDIQGVGLTFLNGHVGLKETSLHIADGEFCTLLGPSGSGKTTLLRTIAGLITPTTGKIFIGGSDVTKLTVQSRNIGFVFQNYALFPHMNVAENIEYPLTLHKWSTADRKARVKEVLELIELTHAAERLVGELSGGQQQRIAIGRALSYRPSLLLLDEPMGALDRRLRQQLGADLRDVQQRTGITAVYVTHDQEEAFILSDRVAIMNHGEILQYSSPSDLYFRPVSRFVAKFLGEANLIDVSAVNRLGNGRVSAVTALGTLEIANSQAQIGQGDLAVVVRPEDLRFQASNVASQEFVTPIQVVVERELFLGSRSLVTISTGNGGNMTVECARADIPAPGQPAWITWKHSASVLVNN